MNAYQHELISGLVRLRRALTSSAKWARGISIIARTGARPSPVSESAAVRPRTDFRMPRPFPKLNRAPKGNLCSASVFHGILGVSAIVLAANAALAQTSLNIGSTPGYPRTTVSVPIDLRRASNAVAAQFDVGFNQNKVTAGEIVPVASLASHIVRSREIAPGVRRVLVYSRSNGAFQSNGFSANLPFSISANEHVSSGPITPANLIVARRDGIAVAPVGSESGTIFIGPVHRNPDGQVQFFLPSLEDERYLIQASTNLLDWMTLTNVVAASEFMDLVDADAPKFPHRFYRPILYEAAGEITRVSRTGNGELTVQVSGLA